MVITPEAQAFLDKWFILFADNEFENITEQTFRAFTTDVARLRDQGQYRQLLLRGKGNSAEALLAASEVQPGLLYAVTGTPDPADPAGLAGTWNATGKEQVVYVIGLAPTFFACIGCLLDVTTSATTPTPVQVDVLAGTHQPLGAAIIGRNISLPDAQQLQLNAAPDPRVVSNMLYAVESTKWNGKDGATVYVHGLNPNSYAPIGYTLVKGVYALVNVDVAAGTFSIPTGPDLSAYVTLGTKQTIFEDKNFRAKLAINQPDADYDAFADTNDYAVIRKGYLKRYFNTKSITRYSGYNNTFSTLTPDSDGFKAAVSVGGGDSTIRLNTQTIYFIGDVNFAGGNWKLFCFGAKLFPGFPTTTFRCSASVTILFDNAAFWGDDKGFIFDSSATTANASGGGAATWQLYRPEFVFSPQLNPTCEIQVLNGATLLIEDGTVSPEFRFTTDTISTIILRGSTPGTIGSGATDIWPVGTVDERLVATGPANPGNGYTDAQARAAQLGRVAPANTTTITLTSESPRDYGTASSGTFTVDATGAVPGAWAGFRLKTGATAPSFHNAPVDQPFIFVGIPYAPNTQLGYSILVQSDAIEVAIYPR